MYGNPSPREAALNLAAAWGIPKPIARGKNSYFTYVGQEVDPAQVEELAEPFKGFSFYHKYSDKQVQSLKKLLQYLGNKHNVDVRESLPNLIRKERIKAFGMIGTKICINTSGVWSHANVKSSKKDRKSTRLNSSHVRISYAVFCLRKK